MKRQWNLPSDALAIAGGLALVAGSGWWSPAAGLVVAGILLCLAAIATAQNSQQTRR